jgi:hypothetical protein
MDKDEINKITEWLLDLGLVVKNIKVSEGNVSWEVEPTQTRPTTTISTWQ